MESVGTYPRVAHRHLYLWIERKANEHGAEAARRLKTIPSLEAFYGEVAAANAGNRHYNPLKLQEMVVRAPPYSLLYNRTLNMSTNVLKRWNRTNGMANWFLWRAKCGPPSAAEVIHLSRVHVARALMRRPDYQRVFGPAAVAAASVKTEPGHGGGDAASVASSSSSVSGPGGGGKRRRTAGGKAAAAAKQEEEGEHEWGAGAVATAAPSTDEPPTGPGLLLPAATPPGVGTPEALHAWLLRRHPSSTTLALPAIRAAVEAGTWALVPPAESSGSGSGSGSDAHETAVEGGCCYAPSVGALEAWSAANGLWQEFARLCLERGVRFDQCLFDFPDLPSPSPSPSTATNGGGVKAEAEAEGQAAGGAEGGEEEPAGLNGHGKGPGADEALKPPLILSSTSTPLSSSPPSVVAKSETKTKGRKRARASASRSSAAAASVNGASGASVSGSAASGGGGSGAGGDARAAQRRRSIAHLFGPGEQLLEEGGEQGGPDAALVLGEGEGGQLPRVVAAVARRLASRVGAASRGRLRLVGGRLHDWGEGEGEGEGGGGASSGAAEFWHGKALWAPGGDPCVGLLFPYFLPRLLDDDDNDDDTGGSGGHHHHNHNDGDAHLGMTNGHGAGHGNGNGNGRAALDSLVAGTGRFVLDAPPQGQGRAQQCAALVFGGAGPGAPVLVVLLLLLSAESAAGAGQARFMARYFFADPDGMAALPALGAAPVALGDGDGDEEGEGREAAEARRAHVDDRASARLWHMHAVAAAKAKARARAKAAGKGKGAAAGSSASSSRAVRIPPVPPPPSSLPALLQQVLGL